MTSPAFIDEILTRSVHAVADMPGNPARVRMRSALPTILADKECRKLAARSMRNPRAVDKLQRRIMFLATGYEHKG